MFFIIFITIASFVLFIKFYDEDLLDKLEYGIICIFMWGSMILLITIFIYIIIGGLTHG